MHCLHVWSQDHKEQVAQRVSVGWSLPGGTLQNTWNPLDWPCLRTGWATGTSGDQGHSSHLEKHTERRGGRAGSTHQAHRKSADLSCRASGTQLDPSIGMEQLPHSNCCPIFPANTAWMCWDFIDKGLETTASTCCGNEAFRPFWFQSFTNLWDSGMFRHW